MSRVFVASLLVLSVSATELEMLRPGVMGVDHAGLLWGWSAEQHSAFSIGRSGTPRFIDVPRHATWVDVDAAWGVVTIGAGGKELSILRWDQDTPLLMSLGNRASSVSWIDEHRVATAPLFAAHLVEVWDLSRLSLLAKLGETDPVDEKTPGAMFARPTLMDYDQRHHELIVLDAYHGRLAAYTLDGKRVRSVTIPHPTQAATDAWLKEQDESHRKRGAPFRPLVLEIHGFGG